MTKHHIPGDLSHTSSSCLMLRFPFPSIAVSIPFISNGMVALLQHNNSTAAHSNYSGTTGRFCYYSKRQPFTQKATNSEHSLQQGNFLMPTAQISSPDEPWRSSQWQSSFHIMQNVLLQCRLRLQSMCEIRDSDSSVADYSDLLVCDMSLGQCRWCCVECGTHALGRPRITVACSRQVEIHKLVQATKDRWANWGRGWQGCRCMWKGTGTTIPLQAWTAP